MIKIYTEFEKYNLHKKKGVFWDGYEHGYQFIEKFDPDGKGDLEGYEDDAGDVTYLTSSGKTKVK